MTTGTLPEFTPDRSAAEVDAALRQALAAGDRARECALLWSAEAEVTIILSNDVQHLAHFEALIEKVQKMGLVAADADQMDVVLAALESLVSSATPASE